MFAGNWSERLPAAVLSAAGHWDAQHRLPRRRPAPTSADQRQLTIAFSVQLGAGGSSVSRLVGETLRWPVFDHELLQRIADDLHVRSTECRAQEPRNVAVDQSGDRQAERRCFLSARGSERQRQDRQGGAKERPAAQWSSRHVSSKRGHILAQRLTFDGGHYDREHPTGLFAAG